MAFFDKNQLSDERTAEIFLQYFNHSETVNQQFSKACKKIAGLQLLCVALILASQFWFPENLVKWRSAWFLVILLAFIFLTIEKIELLTKHETIQKAVQYFDKQKLMNAQN